MGEGSSREVLKRTEALGIKQEELVTMQKIERVMESREFTENYLRVFRLFLCNPKSNTHFYNSIKQYLWQKYCSYHSKPVILHESQKLYPDMCNFHQILEIV